MSNILKSIEIHKIHDKFTDDMPEYITISIDNNLDNIIQKLKQQLREHFHDNSEYPDEYELGLVRYNNIQLSLFMYNGVDKESNYLCISLELVDKNINKEIYLISNNNGKSEKVSIYDLYLLIKTITNTSNNFQYNLFIYDNTSLRIRIDPVTKKVYHITIEHKLN